MQTYDYRGSNVPKKYGAQFHQEYANKLLTFNAQEKD